MGCRVRGKFRRHRDLGKERENVRNVLCKICAGCCGGRLALRLAGLISAIELHVAVKCAACEIDTSKYKLVARTSVFSLSH